MVAAFLFPLLAPYSVAPEWFLHQVPAHQSQASSSLPFLRWLFFLRPLLKILFCSRISPALTSFLSPPALMWSSLSFSSSSSSAVSFSQHLPPFLKHLFTNVPETPRISSALQPALAASGCIWHRVVRDLLPERPPHSHTTTKTLTILPNTHLKPRFGNKKKKKN